MEQTQKTSKRLSGTRPQLLSTKLAARLPAWWVQSTNRALNERTWRPRKNTKSSLTVNWGCVDLWRSLAGRTKYDWHWGEEVATTSDRGRFRPEVRWSDSRTKSYSRWIQEFTTQCKYREYGNKSGQEKPVVPSFLKTQPVGIKCGHFNQKNGQINLQRREGF